MASGVASALAVEPVDQGQNWTPAAQARFYTQDQGSQIIKYTWFKALKREDGQPFLADQLGRYGYLGNPASPDGLPVGFTKAGGYVGMSCAACHTRQINVDSKQYRIDGGPAIVDVQSFFADLDRAVANVRSPDANFQAFAQTVLGQSNPDSQQIVGLKAEVDVWFKRYDTLMSRALPNPAWGPGRLDAVSMIFNRLTGLALGPPPDYIIAENIKTADAPVRYPFLWNATIQDKTQWPGFAQNGNDVLGMARNVGEVFGVFATFAPQKAWWHPLGIDYKTNNSTNFSGLGQLENLVKKIGPPKYPWPIDKELAAEGQAIYEAPGSCISCHGIVKNPIVGTWKTPMQDVGTDSREYDVLKRVAVTGVLEGKDVPFILAKLGEVDTAFNILKLAVTGSIIQHTVPILSQPLTLNNLNSKALKDVAPQQLSSIAYLRSNFKLPEDLKSLNNAFVDMPSELTAMGVDANPEHPYRYEARVLKGIWAAAPYLHNGSVPTLADLLKTQPLRRPSFKIGPNYDLINVGLAENQDAFGDQTLVTSGERNSGNYNGGHDTAAYGTSLSDPEKEALIEYLKSL